MEVYGRNPGAGAGIEESMRMLGLGGGGAGKFPERPGEINCAYYVRTGLCGYGERCRFNHPPERLVVGLTAGRTRLGEYPERIGQPLCEYYLKTGTCKFGSNCKFHHPRPGAGSLRPTMFNYCGYPIRPGEKECAYYMKTGQCKFGSTCKFHHPEPGGLSVPSPAPTFSSMVHHPSNPIPQQYPPSGSWQLPRPSALPGSYLPGSYAPMLMSHGVVPVQRWSQYAAMSPGVSPGRQQAVQARPVYGISNQASLVPTNARLYPPVSSSVMPLGAMQREHIFPERHGQPECQFFMKTGDCKFGATCKYHHPRVHNMPMTNCVLNPLGLPLHPEAQPCAYYIQHGVCKFGATCKFDHPIGGLSYSPSASSLSGIPVTPYPIGISPATMAPSSSSSEIRSELGFSQETLSVSVSTSSGSGGSNFSVKNFRPHLLIRPQTSMSNKSRSPEVGGGL